jgi:hypothetical protein
MRERERKKRYVIEGKKVTKKIDHNYKLKISGVICV